MNLIFWSKDAFVLELDQCAPMAMSVGSHGRAGKRSETCEFCGQANCASLTVGLLLHGDSQTHAVARSSHF